MFAARYFNFFDKDNIKQKFTVLLIEYNHASLDAALGITEHGAIDILGHTSWPFLGEVFLMMQLASSSIGNTVHRSQHRASPNQAAPFQQQRDLVTDTLLEHNREPSEVESSHFSAINHKLLSIIDENTYVDDAARTGKPWKPLVNDPSYVLIAGDASNHSFKMLRRALASEERLTKLIDPGSYPNATWPAWISAEAAARGVRDREFLEEDGTRNWDGHNEL